MGKLMLNSKRGGLSPPSSSFYYLLCDVGTKKLLSVISKTTLPADFSLGSINGKDQRKLEGEKTKGASFCISFHFLSAEDS